MLCHLHFRHFFSQFVDFFFGLFVVERFRVDYFGEFAPADAGVCSNSKFESRPACDADVDEFIARFGRLLLGPII